MIRNLMMILGVSLAVAAFGCSDDETGTGGTGGTPGACTNAADEAMVCDGGFDATVTACATDAGGQGDDTAACLVDEGLSAPCAACYGGITQCVFDNCLGADTGNCAVDRPGDACQTCVAENCDPAFETCRGDVDCGGGTGGTDGGTGGTDGGTGGTDGGAGGTDGGAGGNGGGGGNG